MGAYWQWEGCKYPGCQAGFVDCCDGLIATPGEENQNEAP